MIESGVGSPSRPDLRLLCRAVLGQEPGGAKVVTVLQGKHIREYQGPGPADRCSDSAARGWALRGGWDCRNGHVTSQQGSSCFTPARRGPTESGFRAFVQSATPSSVLRFLTLATPVLRGHWWGLAHSSSRLPHPSGAAQDISQPPC